MQYPQVDNKVDYYNSRKAEFIEPDKLAKSNSLGQQYPHADNKVDYLNSKKADFDEPDKIPKTSFTVCTGHMVYSLGTKGFEVQTSVSTISSKNPGYSSSITSLVSAIGGSPGLVWIKSLTQSYNLSVAALKCAKNILRNPLADICVCRVKQGF